MSTPSPRTLRLAALSACLSLFDLANRPCDADPLNPSEIPLTKFYPPRSATPDSAWILNDVLSAMLALRRSPSTFFDGICDSERTLTRPRQALAFFLPRSATSVTLIAIPCLVHADGIYYQIDICNSTYDLIHIYMPRPLEVEGSPLPTSSVPDEDPTPHGYDPDDEFDDDEDLDDSEDDDEDLDEDDIDRALDEPLTSDDDDDEWDDAETSGCECPPSSEIELKDTSVRPDPYDTF